MVDKLKLNEINALQQPLFAIQYGDGGWSFPIYDICVETGLVRIDVCGLLQVIHFEDIKLIRDADGIEYDPEFFIMINYGE